MGVSGVGKTTIGEALAERLGWRFLDADDLHSPESVAKMAAGTALEDADRWPWLYRLNRELWALEARNENAVLACSALKERYRRRLTDGLADYEVVFLHGPPELIRARLEKRRHRYMTASLLQSQFAALEPPERAIAVDVAAPPEECVARVISLLDR